MSNGVDRSIRPRGASDRWTSRAGLIAPALAAAALTVLLPFFACVRHADIRDEPDASLFVPGPELDAGELPELDSGLGTDAYPTCIERPIGDCYGTLDFPCGLERWVIQTAESCQESTGCVTNGWLEVKMGADGCVQAIAMDQPNDAIVACLLAEVGSVQCPCQTSESTYFFGFGNKGVCTK